MNRDRALFEHFGLSPDAVYWGPQHEKYADVIRAAVTSRRMLGVVGRFGAGKSKLVRHALEGWSDKVEVVYVNNPDRERLKIGQIMTALIDALAGGSETPRRDCMARSIQCARILGERVVIAGREVSIVIENAHRLHANTLLALKDLRESAYYKDTNFLFSVVLVGQEPLRAKLERYGEVKYRTRFVDLSEAAGWMDRTERARYLYAIYKDTVTGEAKERLAGAFASPLELDHHLEGRLEMLRATGSDCLTADDAITLSEQREAQRISLKDLEKVTGFTRREIKATEAGKPKSKADAARLQRALDDYALGTDAAAAGRAA